MDDRVSEALRALPRQSAPPGFRAQVIDRLGQRRPRVAPSSWMLMAASAAMLLAALTIGVREWSRHDERQEAMARIEALRAEQQDLEAELQRLRRQAAAARPVIHLGQTEDLDLVLDLERLTSRSVRPALDEAQSPTTRPAAFPQGAQL